MSVRTLLQTAHHGCGGCGLVHLVLGSLYFGLQVSRRVEVLALFSGAPTLDVVHAYSDGVVVGVDHSAVCGVSEATVVLPPRAVAPLILPTDLQTNGMRRMITCRLHVQIHHRGRKRCTEYLHEISLFIFNLNLI